MKNEQVSDALLKAFREYWNANESISINGYPTKKDAKYEKLNFAEGGIQQLRKELGCQEELPTLTGQLEAYIPAGEPHCLKSKRLKFSISNRQYNALYNRDSDEVCVKFKEIMFQ